MNSITFLFPEFLKTIQDFDRVEIYGRKTAGDENSPAVFFIEIICSCLESSFEVEQELCDQINEFKFVFYKDKHRFHTYTTKIEYLEAYDADTQHKKVELFRKLELPKKIKNALDKIDSIKLEAVFDDTATIVCQELSCDDLKQCALISVRNSVFEACSKIQFRVCYKDGASKVVEYYDENKPKINLETYPIDQEIDIKLNFDLLKDMPVYVINLERQPERFDDVFDYLTSTGFTNIQRWNAVDGETENVETLLQEYGNIDTDNFASNAEMACTLSHFAVLRDFLKSADTHRIIFEDNVVLHSNFAALLNESDLILEEFDVIYMGGTFEHIKHNNKELVTIQEALSAQNSTTRLTNAINFDTHAYVINRKFAHNALKQYRNWGGDDARHNNYYAFGLKEIKSCLLTASPFSSDNKHLIKIKNSGTCGLVFQNKSLMPSLRETLREASVQDSKGKWIHLDKPTTYDYNCFDFVGTPEFDLKPELPATGVLVLKNGIVSQFGETIAENGYEYVSELSFFGKPEHRSTFHAKVMHSFVRTMQQGNIKMYQGTGLNLCSMFANNNVSHFLLDCMGKLAILEELNINLHSFDWIVLPNNTKIVCQQVIDKLDIDPNKIIHINKQVDVARYQFDELYVPSINGKIEYYRKGSFAPLKRLFDAHEIDKTYNIYVSREDGGRDVHNKEDFQKLLEEFDFKTINCSTEVNVVKKFSKANIILGAHGAGLANCVFSNPESTMIELLPEFYQYPYYMSLSYANNMNYQGVMCKDSGITSKQGSQTTQCHRSFNVDIKDLRNILQQIYEKR